MPDILTPQQRHCCMTHIRNKMTKPDMAVREWLRIHGYRYRLRIYDMGRIDGQKE